MTASGAGDVARYYAPDRGAWRLWLAEHHDSARGVWLIYYKKHTGEPTVTYDDAVDEALCFGWIDSRPNALDDARYMQLFSPRKPRSPWSKVNKGRVERLIREGRMAAAGLAAIEAAKDDGSWEAYDVIEALRMPDDLRRALAARGTALEHFERFGASTKKQLLWHVESAKRPETRAKRIALVVEGAAERRNPLMYAPKRGETA